LRDIVPVNGVNTGPSQERLPRPQRQQPQISLETTLPIGNFGDLNPQKWRLRHNAGNFVESAHSTRFSKLTPKQIQRLSAEFPTKQNREFWRKKQGILPTKSKIIAG
jgi:hypothetical protein